MKSQAYREALGLMTCRFTWPLAWIHAPAATRAHLQSGEGILIDFSSTWR